MRSNLPRFSVNILNQTHCAYNAYKLYSKIESAFIAIYAIKTRYLDYPVVMSELKVFVNCSMNYAMLFLSSFAQVVVLVPAPSPPWVPLITKSKSD